MARIVGRQESASCVHSMDHFYGTVVRESQGVAAASSVQAQYAKRDELSYTALIKTWFSSVRNVGLATKVVDDPHTPWNCAE
jgi:hypothetical protein